MPSTPSSSTARGLWSGSFGTVADLLGRMERAGFDLELLSRMRADSYFLLRLAEAAKKGAIDEPLSQHQARVYYFASLSNYFGPREWWELLGVSLTPEHLRQVECFPWPAKLLQKPCPFNPEKRISETHIAFPLWVTTGSTERLEMISLRWLYHHFKPLFYPPVDGAFELGLSSYYFFREPIGFPRWYLVPLEVPAITVGKTLREQLACVPEDYKVAPALVTAAAHLFRTLKTGGILHPQKFWGRSADILSGGNCICMTTNSSTLHLEVVEDVQRERVGLNLMRKQPESG